MLASIRVVFSWPATTSTAHSETISAVVSGASPSGAGASRRVLTRSCRGCRRRFSTSSTQYSQYARLASAQATCRSSGTSEKNSST